MYYKILSQKYLEEAENLKKHIKLLKTQYVLKSEDSNFDELHYRITVLYEMYLDLVHIGKYLQRRREVTKNE